MSSRVAVVAIALCGFAGCGLSDPSLEVGGEAIVLRDDPEPAASLNVEAIMEGKGRQPPSGDLPAGTKVRVSAIDPGSGECRVLVLEGQFEGWSIPIDLANLKPLR